MNYLILILLTVVTFSFFLLFCHFFKKEGVFAFIAVSVIIANIQVTQTLSVFGFVITLGNAMYASSFLATDVISEVWGKREATKAVLLGFVVSFMTLVLMSIVLSLHIDRPSETNVALRALFTPLLRITLGSLVAYLVANLHDVYAFEFFKKKKENLLALRNIGSTLLSQLIDTLVFCFIAFYKSFETNIFVQILVSTYLIKLLLTLVAHPFFRIAIRLVNKGEN